MRSVAYNIRSNLEGTWRGYRLACKQSRASTWFASQLHGKSSCFSQLVPRLLFDSGCTNAHLRFKMLRNKARTGNIQEDEAKGADWQGNISFEKIVTTSTSHALTVPASFVRQHGDKVQKFFILQSEADGQLWTVEVDVYFPHGRPQVVFHGGWKEFAVFNGLVKRDRLTFTLVAKSKFRVSIHRSSDSSKAWPSLRRQPKKHELRPQFIDLTDKPELRCYECNRLFAKEAGAMEAEAVALYSISKAAAADSSPSSSSDMDSHFFEPVQAAAP